MQKLLSFITIREIISRILAQVLVLFGAASLGFLAMRLIPGDPVDVMLGPLTSVDQSIREQIRIDWGLDKPVWEQYFTTVSRLMLFDFGISYQSRRQVLDILTEQAAPTLVLASTAMALAILCAIAIAMVTRRGFFRWLANLLELFAISAPTFWIAMILAVIFNHQLGWIPILSGPEWAKLILPALSLAIPITATLTQYLRQGLLSAESEPFALTVLSRGASYTRLTLNHTLRHSAAASVTLAGYIFGSILGGTVLVETIFSRRGLGRVTLDAITNRDMPIVIAIIFCSALIFIVINLVVDLFAKALDARLRNRLDNRTGVKKFG